MLVSGAIFALLLAAQVPDTAAPAPAIDTTRALFDSAAVTAWKQFNRLWVPETGLARATFDYDRLTTWDMGSVLAALYSARILGLIDDAEYKERMHLTLETLDRLPLFQNLVYNKLYNARTGSMRGRDDTESKTGYAWSATDLGRLLLWLKIVAQDSAQGDLARSVVSRLQLDSVAFDGYMHGREAVSRTRHRRFQEGRIGYEQYAAHGFAAWGKDVENALDVNTHSQPVQVMGIDLLKDSRGMDRLTSEPLVLLGLEAGWTPAEEELARNVLRVQEERFKRTGTITIASEDAVGVAPYYFYYYCVFCNGRSFIVETVASTRALNSPRWISTKATFAWHALLPSAYTQRAIDALAGARANVGWSSGVHERSHVPTRTYDINTAAVILESAAFKKLGRPFLSPPLPPATAPAR